MYNLIKVHVNLNFITFKMKCFKMKSCKSKSEIGKKETNEINKT